MKKIILSIGFGLILNGASAQQAPEGLFINSKAPDFTAVDQQGQTIRLKDILKLKKPVVLVFYRGNWCPFGTKYLTRLQDSLAFIEETGALVIAVSPETPENVRLTEEKTKAGFHLVSDKELTIMKAYDVEYAIPVNTLKRMRSTDIDINAINGKNGEFLPITATYVIDEEGKITYRFFDQDYKKNPTIKTILEHLD